MTTPRGGFPRTELRLTMKIAFEAIGSPSEDVSRVGPGPR